MKIFSKITALICALFILSSVFVAVAEDTNISNEFKLVTQNKNLALYIRNETAEIAVLDKINNYIWYSNPQKRAEDKKAVGVNLMNLNSQLIVKYTDESNQQFLANNYTGSVLKKEFEITKLQDGVKITFDFTREAESFKIPVIYKISDKKFTASILTGEIMEYGNGKIVEISLLPSFGAASIEDKGYMFVPDGSGAIINFNNNKQKYAQYKADVYGTDPILTKTFDKITAKDIKLPVFAVSKNTSGFLAVIEKGDAVSSISASVSGVSDSYNKVFSSFYYRIRDYATLAASSAQAKDVTLVSMSSISVKQCSVSYIFLDNGKNTYSDMAGIYRDYLLDNSLLPKDNHIKYSLVTQYYGGAIRKKSLLGIPLRLFEPLTTYNDVKKTTENFITSGVDSITVSLKGWTKGGLDGKIPTKLTYERAIGGESGFKSLVTFLGQKKMDFYPSVDLTSIYKNGNGISTLLDGTKNILKAPLKQYSYYISTQAQNNNDGAYSLLQPNKTLKVATSLKISAEKVGLTSLLSETVGNVLYSHMNSKTLFDRQQSLKEQIKTLKALSTKIAVNSPNAYSLAYSSFAFNTPAQSSSYDLEDYSVPFYQMVIHGSMSYTIEPSNLNKDSKDYNLRLLEYGACPFYELTKNPTEVFKNTRFSYLYSTDIKNNFKEAVKTYKYLFEISNKIADKKMISHERITDKLVKIVYYGNIQILINYSDSDIEYKGKKVLARDFSFSEVTDNE